MGDASSIIIKELDGQHREVVLKGPALPFQGASWKSKQSIVTTWYPGNGNQATQQVLGPQELPSSWEGVWRRTQMGKNPSSVAEEGGVPSSIIRPTTMRDLLDEIFYGGSRLRVSWVSIGSDGTRGTVVREGRATEWEFPTDRLSDISWKITFDWYGRGGSIQKVVSTRDEGVAGATTALNAAIEASLGLSLPSLPSLPRLPKLPKIPTFSLATLEALTKLPTKLLSDFTRNITSITSKIKQFGQIIDTARNLPNALANTALASAKNSMGIANAFVDKMSRMPIEQATTQRNVRDIVRTAKVLGQNLEAAQAIARASKQLEMKVRSASSANPGGPAVGGAKQATSRASSIITTHIVKQGETLLTISVKYYQSPDHAVDIARANHMPWHTINVDRGKILLIPVLKSSAGV